MEVNYFEIFSSVFQQENHHRSNRSMPQTQSASPASISGVETERLMAMAKM
jgi:hypothetical protein